MERTYASRSYQRSGARRSRTAHTRRTREYEQEEKKMSFEKKLAIQAIACTLIFATIWGIHTAGGETAAWIQNEVRYALTYQIDFQTAYQSSLDVTKYLASFLVKQEGEPSTQPASGEAQASPSPSVSPSPSAQPTVQPTPETSSSSALPML